MAIAFDTTPGGASANSYGSVAEADDYFCIIPEFEAVWSALTTPDKETKLMEATRTLDRLNQNFAGCQTDPDTQALEFPRNGETDVPDEAKDAQFEMVMYNHVNRPFTGTPITSTVDGEQELQRARVEGVVDVSFSQRRTSNSSSERIIKSGSTEAVKAALGIWWKGSLTGANFLFVK